MGGVGTAQMQQAVYVTLKTTTEQIFLSDGVLVAASEDGKQTKVLDGSHRHGEGDSPCFRLWR